MNKNLFYFLFRKKKQDIQTEGIGMKNGYSMEFSLEKTDLVFTKLNEPHPLSGCPDQQGTISLRPVDNSRTARRKFYLRRETAKKNVERLDQSLDSNFNEWRYLWLKLLNSLMN